MQCNNTLKQIGLAVHNFHSARNGLLPAQVARTGPDGRNENQDANWTQRSRASAFVLMMPYYEQSALYDLLSSKTDGFNRMFDEAFWGYVPATSTTAQQLTEAERNSFVSLSVFFCPTRGPRPGVFNPNYTEANR
jgi:hypothetical protein